MQINLWHKSFKKGKSFDLWLLLWWSVEKKIIFFALLPHYFNFLSTVLTIMTKVGKFGIFIRTVRKWWEDKFCCIYAQVWAILWQPGENWSWRTRAGDNDFIPCGRKEPQRATDQGGNRKTSPSWPSQVPHPLEIFKTMHKHQCPLINIMYVPKKFSTTQSFFQNIVHITVWHLFPERFCFHITKSSFVLVWSQGWTPNQWLPDKLASV